MGVEFGVAFLAGLVSFLSPCVLPLVPVYLAYLSGTTYQELASTTPRRWVLLHASFFILGFSSVFIALGASASAIGNLLFHYRALIEKIGGLVLVILGVWMSGLLKADFLYRDIRVHLTHKPAGFFGSILVGAAFAAGWTPCVGPVLAGILLLASRSGSVAQGVLLLSVYALGFAIPLLACALALEKFMRLLKKISPSLPWVERATGLGLVALGALLATGGFSWVSTWVLSYFARWTRFFSALGL